MRSRLAQLSLVAAVWLLVLAPAALAQQHDNGEGFLGETDDRVVTFFSLGVIVFFVVVAFVGSAIQARLDRRKDEEKANRVRQRLGW